MKIVKMARIVPWIIILIQVALVIYVITSFNVDDTTLHRGEIDDFNTGWLLTRTDGTTDEIKLPYYEECKADELITISNVLPKKYWGKTIKLLTADKEISVYIDGQLIYEFGVNDKRDFGKTPGSMTNFIDIPENLINGDIVIKLKAPYDNYGACIDSMTIADRDISILNMFKDNIFEICCTVIMLFSSMGFVFILISYMLVRKERINGSGGTEYLAAFCFLSYIYYLIETKAMHLFYGNQTLYSVTVFLILMSLPVFLISYCVKRFRHQSSKGLYIVGFLSVGNVFIQITLQILNICDFMSMAFLSHGILFLSFLVVMWNIMIISKQGPERRYQIEFAALFIMGVCALCDIIRSYTLTWEHIPKFSRYGTTIFCLLMILAHIYEVMKRHESVLEENAKLLEQKVELAESKNEAKTIFLARMSHEIRTPINAVLGMNKMILSETKDEAIREYANDVESAAQMLLGIVNEILDLSKIESGKMSLVEGEYDVSTIFHDVSNMIALRAQAKNLDFILKVDENIPKSLYGDDVKLRQILTNLLSNAVKYTKNGVVSFTVECEKADESDKVRITYKIKDTGIGIKKEDMPKLFEVFERLDEGKNRAIEGTGLGLSITVQFLKLMNSSLQVESEYGKGSTFSFTIEQRIVDSTPLGDIARNFNIKRQKYEHEEKIKASDKKVLIVDDNNMNRRIFSALLKKSEIQVVEAEGGNECLALVSSQEFDMIFLDHMMPGMDGIETIRAMRTLADNKNRMTPVIAITANAIDGAEAYYLKEGFDGYISKPIEPEYLNNIIKKYI